MTLRERERESIEGFVQRAADQGYLSGRVLDYGCGRQPYRGIVEAAGGEYVGFDHPDLPASVALEPFNARRPVLAGYPDPYVPDVELHDFDAVLCTQVLQYVPSVRDKLEGFRSFLRAGGHLVLSYATNWPEVEIEDLRRFTKAGMERLLAEAGFTILVHERRHSAVIEGEALALGYGCIAKA